MDFKVLKWQILRGSLARRLILKTLLFVLAMIVLSFTQIANQIRTIEPLMLNLDKCSLVLGSITNPHLKFFGFVENEGSLLTPSEESENLTVNAFKELMKKDFLDPGARALFVGKESASAVSKLRKLGFSNAFGVHRHPFFSLLQKRFVYELDFKNNYFDFVFSTAVDRVSVPALLVQEIERVLRPGGTGAMLVGASNFYSGSLVRSATPISLFLRKSNILHVCGIDSFTLVIFKKRLDNIALFEHYRLPNECPSISNNKPFMQHLEPLVNENLGHFETEKTEEREISYLPKFTNVSSRNRLVYINVGAGELVQSSISKAFKPNYPIHPQSFNVYVVDHNLTVLSSYVKKPGITFVYHPGLVEEKVAPSLAPDEYLSAPMDEGRFEFIHWFKETIKDGDFVLLMMNARAAEFKVLFELFESGGICHVDELFLPCSEGVDCMSLFKSLRNAGVFVHQWFGD